MKISRLISTLVLSLTVSVGAGAQGTSPAPNRPALEQQLRERLAQITRQRLQLDDAQMAKLQAVNARYAPQMAALVTQERQTRQRLRAQLTSPAPDQNQVSTLLDGMLQLQKQRLALLDSEQHDLSAFLTPVQRAKYMALQQQIRRRADQLRAGNQAGRRGQARNRPLR